MRAAGLGGDSPTEVFSGDRVEMLKTLIDWLGEVRVDGFLSEVQDEWRLLARLLLLDKGEGIARGCMCVDGDVLSYISSNTLVGDVY